MNTVSTTTGLEEAHHGYGDVAIYNYISCDIHTYIYTHTCTYIHTCIHAHIDTCAHTHKHTFLLWIHYLGITEEFTLRNSMLSLCPYMGYKTRTSYDSLFSICPCFLLCYKPYILMVTSMADA